MTLASARTTLTVEIPGDPPKECNPNAHVHWRTKAKAVASLRDDAWKAALGAKSDAMYLAYEAVFDAVPVAIHAVIHWSKGRKTIDHDNAVASLKAAIDGLQDADIFGNDKWVKQLTVEQVRAKDGIGRTVLTIVETTDD